MSEEATAPVEIPPVFLTATLCEKATREPTTGIWSLRNVVTGWTVRDPPTADGTLRAPVTVPLTLALLWTCGAVPGPFDVTLRYVAPNGRPDSEKHVGSLDFREKQRTAVWNPQLPLRLDDYGLHRLEIRANGQLLTTVPFWLDRPEDEQMPLTAH